MNHDFHDFHKIRSLMRRRFLMDDTRYREATDGWMDGWNSAEGAKGGGDKTPFTPPPGPGEKGTRADDNVQHRGVLGTDN